ncbi:MAG: hypothetical protein M1819_007212 [Sarea resinae]|nr:MAG: hypothetical protein M1819_007212 [Sarea resinae]
MDDRKRPAAHDHNDATPPLKKHVTSVNGVSRPHPDADMPWKDELERFQKDAIFRQMQEYKRERSTLEGRLAELTKKFTYHDDHLRVIDTWFKQLLDEIKIISNQTDKLGFDANDEDKPSFPSALLFADNEKFEAHLKARSKDIRSAISQVFANPPSASPDVVDLQGRLSQLLASEKTHITDLETVRAEKEQLEERLENASFRYMVAEKKLERAKSAAVAKLERQAIFGGRNEAGSGIGSPGQSSSNVKTEGGTNGVTENSEGIAEAETARKEAVAAAQKQKEQLDKLEAENTKLQEHLTAANARLSRLSDDDYARTDLFKQLKSQHEDVIKRINHLEATNVQLREEAEKLQAERTAYRIQMENESQAAIGDVESRLARAESDLARIRNGRDELIVDITMRKAAQDQEKVTTEQVKELAEARDKRIDALESEVGRLRLQLGENDTVAGSASDIEGLSLEELRTKYQTLEKKYSLLSSELPSMGEAWKKASTLASKKVAEFAGWEEKVARLSAEKTKADQKYFGAMKAKESREAEVRSLRNQNQKSSGIVTQLKEAESHTRTLVTNLEKQLSETKEALTTMTNQQRALQQQVSERVITEDGLKTQVNELKQLLATKDTSLSASAHSQRQAESDLERLKVRLEETKKSLESWKSKSLGNQSQEYESLRSIAICTVCRKNFKNTAIKTCGHVFCQECVEERIQSRSRKCPNCNRPFGSNDYLHVTL